LRRLKWPVIGPIGCILSFGALGGSVGKPEASSYSVDGKEPGPLLLGGVVDVPLMESFAKAFAMAAMAKGK